MSDVSFYQYWIGRNIDYRSVWEDLDAGEGYISKFNASEFYLLRLSFQKYDLGSPLFNHEAVYKTVKGVFHDLKLENFSPEEYDSYGPIYLYELKRGSEDWFFLAQLRPALLMLSEIVRGFIASRKDFKEIGKADWEIAKIQDGILASHPNASQKDKDALIDAKTSSEIKKALKNLNRQGLARGAISKDPYSGEIGTSDVEMVEING